MLEKDRLCVITYDSNVFVNFELLHMTSENKDFAEQQIKGIVEGSSTNLCEGLLQGLCEILDRKQEEINDLFCFSPMVSQTKVNVTIQILRFDWLICEDD